MCYSGPTSVDPGGGGAGEVSVFVSVIRCGSVKGDQRLMQHYKMPGHAHTVCVFVCVQAVATQAATSSARPYSV